MSTIVPTDPIPLPVALPGTHAEFADAPLRCTWVDGNGRCPSPPIMGSATSSSCADHRPATSIAPPSIPLTPEESISQPTVDAPLGPINTTPEIPT